MKKKPFGHQNHDQDSDEDEGEDTSKSHKKGLSAQTKGLIVGATGTLAIVGLVAAILQQEAKPKAKAKAKPAHKKPEASPDDSQETGSGDDEAEVEITETETPDGPDITAVLKDVSAVGAAARSLTALEPVAEALIALL